MSGEATDHGFLFNSSAAPASQWTALDYPGATNTIPHSTFDGLVVGNWDVLATANPDFQTYPLAGNAFIYNISTATFTTNDKPGAISTTAYGIYDNMIAGGYADTPAAPGGVQPEHGYIYDMTTQVWTTYDHPGAIITHFDGITAGNSPGAYTLIGDWLGASEPANAPLHAFILQVKDGVALNWTDFDIAGSAVTSGNSVYQNTAVGVFLTDPSTGTNGYVATIPCVASGTRIMTPDGMVPVERLRPGMLVLTAGGRGGTDHLAWPPQSVVHEAPASSVCLAGAGACGGVCRQRARTRPMAQPGSCDLREWRVDPDQAPDRWRHNCAGKPGDNHLLARRADASRHHSGGRPARGKLPGNRRPLSVQQWRFSDGNVPRLRNPHVGGGGLRAARCRRGQARRAAGPRGSSPPREFGAFRPRATFRIG